MKFTTLSLFLFLLFLTTFLSFSFTTKNNHKLNNQQWPVYPFTRTLQLGDKGNDVFLFQELLIRSPFCKHFNLSTSEGIFDKSTEHCFVAFQLGNKLNESPSTVLTPTLANDLLTLHLSDNYKDTFNKTVLPNPYKYRVYIPVYKNRSIETTGRLYDKYGNLLHQFTCRTHGQQEFNELTTNGNTPTGLYSFDLNTPEPDPKEYGPYDVNRAVIGLKGNALMVYPKIRSGILLHTGEWDNWNKFKPMPNSHGCVHAHPEDIKKIAEILKNQLGVVAHENTLGKYPYPYVSQGLLSIELQN
ncbi:hypothetical protein ABK040_013281 [Willaertia magna]